MSNEYSDYIRKYYDDLAEKLGERYHYERWMKDILRRRDYEQTLKSLLYHVRNKHFERALEIGCGVGTWSVHISRFCDSLTILDISPHMVKAATDMLHKAGFYNVQQVVGDFQDANLVIEGSYDAIFSIRAIEYMQNKSYVLSRMHKLLKHGGFALIITKNPNVGIIPFAFLLTRRIFKPPKIFANLIHYRDLLVIAKKIGFKDICAYPVIISYHFPLCNEKYEKMLSDRLHEILYKRRINPVYLTRIESYVVVMRAMHNQASPFD
jgi:ubiquinone/menaquinone biosynthesis C-methylase UbiE